jgi:eukaryotic-like serine/threonine-protein kinase
LATAPDEFVIDKYKLLNCISSGQHSQIWDCVEAAGNTGRHFAMKLLQEKAMADKAQIASLKHEFAVGATLGHPNILKYIELSVKKGRAYFVMELFTSPNIKQLLYADVGAMQNRTHRVIELTSLALEHMHQKGWIHRDIKPDNILATKGGDVRLIDFSLTCKPPSFFAKYLGSKPLIQGTRTYMSPEQIMRRPVSFQTDMYSLGITLFEMLTGQPPFKGATPQDLLVRHVAEPAPAPSFFNKNVTEDADKIVDRMLKKKPTDRYESMGEFLAEFRKTTLFKEQAKDVSELKAQAEAKHVADTDVRLDSRADAKRRALGESTQSIVLPAAPAAAPAAVPAAGTGPKPPAAAPAGRPPVPAGGGGAAGGAGGGGAGGRPAGPGGPRPAGVPGAGPGPAGRPVAGGPGVGAAGAPRPGGAAGVGPGGARPGGAVPGGAGPGSAGPGGAAKAPVKAPVAAGPGGTPPAARPGVPGGAPPGSPAAGRPGVPAGQPAVRPGQPPARPGQPPGPAAARPGAAPPRPAPPRPAPPANETPAMDELPPVS